jgi:ribonuclease P protein component
MLPRLKTRRQFLHVAGAGRKWVAPGLILQVCPHDGDGAPGDDGADEAAGLRVGFTVSRKVGGAVVRNRARRRLRQAAECVMPDQAAGGRDYVLIGRRTTVDRPFADLVADLETALARLGAQRHASATQGSDRRSGHETH